MPGQAVITINSRQWSASVANTYAELVQGLSGVESMLENSGVLFDMSSDQNLIQINMTEMLFALDIIFISSQYGVVGVLHNVSPGEENVRFEAITSGARYFLEVNAAEAVDVVHGDTVNIEGYPDLNSSPDPLDISAILQLLVATAIIVPMMTMLGKGTFWGKDKDNDNK